MVWKRTILPLRIYPYFLEFCEYIFVCHYIQHHINKNMNKHFKRRSFDAIWSGRWIILIVHLQNSMATQDHKAVDDETQGHKAVDDEKISSIWQHLGERRPWCLHKASVMALSLSRIEVLALLARNKQSEEICGRFATASEAERIEFLTPPAVRSWPFHGCLLREKRTSGWDDRLAYSWPAWVRNSMDWRSPLGKTLSLYPFSLLPRTRPKKK